MLSLGPQAPFWADNGSQFLAPFFTRQAEIGAKYEPGQRILLTTAFFHMRAPFFYPRAMARADSTLSRKAARPITASKSAPRAKPPTGCGLTVRPRP